MVKRGQIKVKKESIDQKTGRDWTVLNSLILQNGQFINF